MQKIYTLKDEGGVIHRMNLAQILDEINRDRSEGWQEYDKTDWLEGLQVFTEYELID